MALLGGHALLRTDVMVDLKINSGTKKKKGGGRMGQPFVVCPGSHFIFVNFHFVGKVSETQGS